MILFGIRKEVYKMPKMIKKPQAKHTDIVFRRWALGAFFSAALFGSVFGALIKTILDSGKAVPMSILFVAYVVYTAVTAVASVMGFRAYNREDVGAALFQGILLCLSAVFALVNVRLAVVMLLESFGKSEASKKLIGEQSVSEFITSQRTAWVLMAVGLGFCVAVGVLAIVKLATYKNNK